MMTICVSCYKFGGHVPDLDQIHKKATDIVGLKIEIKASPASADDPYVQYRAHFWFTFMPDQKLEIYVYKPGAVKKWLEQFSSLEAKYMPRSQGYDETDSMRHVYLKTYIQFEPTLFFITKFALEALGGIPSYEGEPDYMREIYCRKISEEELKERMRDQSWFRQELKRRKIKL
jgi:hypothetical protein